MAGKLSWVSWSILNLLKGSGKLQDPEVPFVLGSTGGREHLPQACIILALAESHVQGYPAGENKQPLKASGFLLV